MVQGRAFRASALAASLILALAAGPADAGPPYRTDDPEPVDLGHWEVYAFSQATRIQGDLSGEGPAVEVNYGAAPNLQLHIVVPLAFNRPAGGGTAFGLGDTELGVKYRFVEESKTGWAPQVGVFPLVELPTGEAAHGLGAGYTRIFLPVWLQKSAGPWTAYGGAGYWINPGPGNRDYWFTGFLIQRQIAAPLALGVEVFHQTADTALGRDSTGFNVGAVWDITSHYHLLLSAGRGLQAAAASNALSCYAGLQWTF
ncbi:MAG: hypothetical protein ABI306_07760 [Caulobacteraceae bacterium]